MFKNKSIRHIKRLDSKLKKLSRSHSPSGGWISSTRSLLNMSLSQLGKKLGMTPQAVRDMEVRERDGRVTVKLLKKVADVFEMDLSYVFMPRRSLEELVLSKSLEKAKQMDQTMILEAQGVSKEELNNQIKEEQKKLSDKLNKIIWD